MKRTATEQFIIDRYLGVPFKWGSRDPKEGLDCWQFVRLVYEHLGFYIWTLDGVQYPDSLRRVKDTHFLENYHREWDEVKTPELFDVVLLRDHHGNVSHIGVVLSGNSFIHCARAGVIISSLKAPEWRGKIHGFYHYRAKT